MRKWSKVFGVLCALLQAASTVAAPAPVEAFFRDPVFSAAELSPDGRRVAMLVSSKGTRLQLAVLDLETLKPQAVAGDAERDVARFHWVNDQRLVYSYRIKLTGPNLTDEGPGLFAVSVKGDENRVLMATGHAFITAGGVDSTVLKPYHLLMDVPGFGMGDDVHVNKAGERSTKKVDYIDVMRLNTRTGRSKDIELPLHAHSWVFGHDGEPLAVMSTQEGQSRWHIWQADGRWAHGALFDPVVGGGYSPQYQSPDGTLYGAASAQGFAAVYVFDRATGRPVGKPVVAVPGFDIRPHFIANDKKLLGIRFTVDAELTQWLDEDMKALQAGLDKALPTTANRLSVPRHGDSPWVLVQAFSDAQPTITYIYNRSTRKLARLGQSLPDIQANDGGQTDFHRVPARDGLPLPVYLTLPPGGGKKLPMVVLVHGGPWLRGADWRFDPEVQFLASRGYAVLQPAFRGSTGYGQKHFQAGFGQWGLSMQDDVMDALRWAVDQGHADPQRVCIAGASYGGYAALMGLARDGAQFRCAVAWVAVSDPLLLFDSTWTEATEEVRRYGMARMIGDPKADAAQLNAVSPLRQAARIQKPLLLAYGGWDTRVAIVHGEQLRDALKPHNPDVEWVVYREEGHGWAQPDNRIDFWTHVEKFLARHLAPAEGNK